jgi:predicted membrane protein
MYINSFMSTIVAVLFFFIILTVSIQLLPYAIIAYVIYRLYKYVRTRVFKEPRKDGGIDLEEDVVFYEEAQPTEQMKQAVVIDVE